MSDHNPLIEPPSQAPVRTTILKPRPLLVRLLTEHNPFYLLSAACMLASCLALTNTLTWNPIATKRLLTLIVTLNLYEAALLGIALFLVTRRRHPRDGRMLLLLQAFFLVDFTFLNAEIATSAADFRTGVLVNGVLFVLAAIKIALVLRVLRPTFTLAQYGFVLVQLAILFGTPCLFRWVNVHRHSIGPRDFYVLWWVTALLPALHEFLSRVDARRALALSVAPNAQAAPTTTYLALPYVSLLTHFGILHYVYDIGFYGAHAAPALLGLAIVLNRFSPTTLVPRRDLLVLRLLLPLAAVLVSMNNPFVFPVRSSYPSFTLTPLNMAVDGAFLTYVFCFLREHARLFLCTGAVANGLYILGPSWRQMAEAAEAAWKWSTAAGERLLPKTVADWGVAGLVASFAFLALGFWVSLTRRPATSPSDEPGPAS